MADENVERTSSEDQRVEAAEHGWADKDAWRGNPGEWVDADVFLERSRPTLRVLKEQRDEFSGRANAAEARVAALEAEARATRATLAAIEEQNEEAAEADIAETRANLKTEIAEASAAGNHALVADLTEKMADLAAKTALPKEDKPAARTDAPQLHPEVVVWVTQNPDFSKNPRKMALAEVEAAEMRAKGDKRVGKAFMDEVAANVEKSLGGTRRANRVAGDNGSSGRQNDEDGGDSKTYADLPAEAKQACDRMNSRLVGAGKKHKDVASWRASYVKQYYR